ncbi:MAG: hypothetical protein R3F14_43610 [Polyangiaceae bacterium]
MFFVPAGALSSSAGLVVRVLGERAVIAPEGLSGAALSGGGSEGADLAPAAGVEGAGRASGAGRGAGVSEARPRSEWAAGIVGGPRGGALVCGGFGRGAFAGSGLVGLVVLAGAGGRRRACAAGDLLGEAGAQLAGLLVLGIAAEHLIEHWTARSRWP